MNRFRNIMFVIVACLMAVTLALSGCGPKPTEAPATEEAAPAAEAEAEEEVEPAAEAGDLVFAVVPKIAHPFYDDVRAGLEEKAGELGVEFQWIAPPTGNPAEQVQILEDLINKGVNGIGLAPLEASSVAPVIAKATEAGIPVVTFDSDAPESERVAYFGTDNYAAGYEEGEVLAEPERADQGDRGVLRGELPGHRGRGRGDHGRRLRQGSGDVRGDAACAPGSGRRGEHERDGRAVRSSASTTSRRFCRRFGTGT